MNLSPRLRQILIILLQEEQILSVQKLADEIKVSKRTVQRELENVDDTLKEFGLSLQTKPGMGIWLCGDDADKKRLLGQLQEEDIIDSGRTLAYLTDLLSSRGPASLNICTLLDKPDRRETEVEVKYVGFEIPDKFVIGYGLDYNQFYRNLPYVGVVEQ